MNLSRSCAVTITPASSNEWWVADNHTFDVLTLGPDGNKHRLYLTAFIDARRGIFTGWHVTETPSAYAVLLALRRGILERGIPENILTDNGSDFCAWDVGGRGHRKKNAEAEANRPPTIMEHLGIRIHTALPRNAQAKPVERKFLDVKGQFSRLWATYTGGNVTEKPECLKKVLKKGHVPTDAEFIEAVDTLIRGFYNMQPYSGPVAADRKYIREDVYAMRMGELRKPATPEDLRLMMMRTTRPQTVGQRGVKVKVGGVYLEYFTQDFLWEWQKKKVYVRYDPDHLEKCYVYDTDGNRFICDLPLDQRLTMEWGATGEEVAEAARYVRQYTKRTKEATEAARVPGLDQQALMENRLAVARQRMDGYTPPKSRAPIRLVRAEDMNTEPLQAAQRRGRGRFCPGTRGGAAKQRNGGMTQWQTNSFGNGWRYIDQYKDDKESGVNMGTVGLAMGYKSGAAVVSAYLSGTYKGRVDTLEARLKEYFRNVEARTEQDSKLADIPMPKEYVKLSISERVFTSIRLAHMRGSIVAVVGDSPNRAEYNSVYPSSSYYLEATPVNKSAELAALSRKWAPGGAI